MTISIGMSFLDTTPKAQLMKEIIEELDIIKIKNVCFMIDTFKRVIRQAIDWKKYLQKANLVKKHYLKYKVNS